MSTKLREVRIYIYHKLFYLTNVGCDTRLLLKIEEIPPSHLYVSDIFVLC